jgi:hypothetical protein
MHAAYANPEGTDVALTEDDGTLRAVKPDDPILEGLEIEPFAAPSAPGAAITPREFRGRFTLAERAAVTLAASRAMEAGDAALQVFLDDLSSSQFVELGHPDLLAGMVALVAAGLLSQARADEITAPPDPA